MARTVKAAPPLPKLAKLITDFSYRHPTYQIFSDFVEMSALAISNSVDIQQREKREARYMEIVKRYTKEEVIRFPEMLAALVNELEAGVADVLGRTYHDLELHNKWAGQYFTPFEVCRMMAKMTCGDVSQIPECGFLTVGEPACGSGAMVLAFAEAMKEAGFNYQNQLHVTAVDIDSKCVHIAYLQLSMLHIPAVVVHGNSLSLEEWGRWYTPAHVMDLWGHKLRRKRADEDAAGLITKPQPIAAVAAAEISAPVFTVNKRGQGLLFGDL